MWKRQIYFSLITLLIGSSGFAESLVCQPKDLKVSVETIEISGRQNFQLGVTCQGHELITYLNSSPYNYHARLSEKPSLEELSFSSLKTTQDQSEAQHYDNRMKSFLAALLTAKTSGLSVTITYETMREDPPYSIHRLNMTGVTIQ